MPHFTSSGYSGNVVEVELHTNALGSVRLHGVVTDFADFYATGGVGPYNGQVGEAHKSAESLLSTTRALKVLVLGRQLHVLSGLECFAALVLLLRAKAPYPEQCQLQSMAISRWFCIRLQARTEVHLCN